MRYAGILSGPLKQGSSASVELWQTNTKLVAYPLPNTPDIPEGRVLVEWVPQAGRWYVVSWEDPE